MNRSLSTHLLRIDASPRGTDSVTRLLTDELVQRLRTQDAHLQVTTRDLALTPPAFVDADWIAASATDPATRNAHERAVLAQSDILVGELMAADLLVLGVPVHNFGIPAALKAWIDQVARARLTFRYTAQGPEGLLTGKKAFIVLASGGLKVGSDSDFASGYLRHTLGFLGIEEVEVIAADRLMLSDKALPQARERIARFARSAA